MHELSEQQLEPNTTEPNINKPNVVITGFGPFRDVAKNPSWLVISDIKKLNIQRPVNIVVKMIEVAYKEVDRQIPKLWQDYKPIVMINVGLAAFETCIRLETRARLGPYCKCDVRQEIIHQPSNAPLTNNEIETDIFEARSSIANGDFDEFKSSLNIKSICDQYNKFCRDCNELSSNEQNLDILNSRLSDDAGLYVCEYTYMKSLSISDCGNAVFIHIPDTKSYSLDAIRHALKCIIELIVDEVLHQRTPKI